MRHTDIIDRKIAILSTDPFKMEMVYKYLRAHKYELESWRFLGEGNYDFRTGYCFYLRRCGAHKTISLTTVSIIKSNHFDIINDFDFLNSNIKYSDCHSAKVERKDKVLIAINILIAIGISVSIGCISVSIVLLLKYINTH